MASLNKVLLIGNVGKDPDVRHLEGGVTTATFTLATTERFKDREQTEWHNIVVWRQLADLAEKYIRKGSQLYIEGRIRTRSWDGQDGQKRYTTEIVADAIQLLGSRRENGGPGVPPPPTVDDMPAAYQRPAAAQPAYSQPAQQTYSQPAPQPVQQPAAPNPDSLDPTEVDDLPF